MYSCSTTMCVFVFVQLLHDQVCVFVCVQLLHDQVCVFVCVQVLHDQVCVFVHVQLLCDQVCFCVCSCSMTRWGWCSLTSTSSCSCRPSVVPAPATWVFRLYPLSLATHIATGQCCVCVVTESPHSPVSHIATGQCWVCVVTKFPPTGFPCHNWSVLGLHFDRMEGVGGGSGGSQTTYWCSTLVSRLSR